MSTDTTMVRLLADKEAELQDHFRRFNKEAQSVTRSIHEAVARGAEGFLALNEPALRDARTLAQDVVELRQRIL